MKTRGWWFATLLASLVGAPVTAQEPAQGKTEPTAWPALTATAKPWTLEVTNLPANRIRDLDLRKVPWKTMREINLVSVK